MINILNVNVLEAEKTDHRSLSSASIGNFQHAPNDLSSCRGAGKSRTSSRLKSLVLTRQNGLSQARGLEAQTLTDYNKAIAALQMAISTTLSDNSIEIQSGK